MSLTSESFLLQLWNVLLLLSVQEEFEAEKSYALQELKEVFSQEQDKTKQTHQDEKKQLSAKLQQQMELTKQVESLKILCQCSFFSRNCLILSFNDVQCSICARKY